MNSFYLLYLYDDIKGNFQHLWNALALEQDSEIAFALNKKRLNFILVWGMYIKNNEDFRKCARGALKLSRTCFWLFSIHIHLNMVKQSLLTPKNIVYINTCIQSSYNYLCNFRRSIGCTMIKFQSQSKIVRVWNSAPLQLSTPIFVVKSSTMLKWMSISPTLSELN